MLSNALAAVSKTVRFLGMITTEEVSALILLVLLYKSGNEDTAIPGKDVATHKCKLALAKLLI